MSTKEEMETAVMQNKRVWEETVRESISHEVKKAEIIGITPDLLKVLELKSKMLKKTKKVLVIASPLLEIARAAAEKKMNPLVVNAGNNNDPIKIVEGGAVGPESDLMRRSNLGSAILSDTHYPIKEGSVLYSTGVTVFKNASYAICRPFKISVVTIPPISRPSLVSIHGDDGTMSEDYQSSSEKDKMQARIDSMFQTAILKGHRTLIVDDFGCSIQYANPIKSVIEMFNSAMSRYPVRYVFFSVVENTMPGSRSSKKKNDYKNYVMFNNHIQRENL
jgi:hypothetical protein